MSLSFKPFQLFKSTTWVVAAVILAGIAHKADAQQVVEFCQPVVKPVNYQVVSSYPIVEQPVTVVSTKVTSPPVDKSKQDKSKQDKSKQDESAQDKAKQKVLRQKDLDNARLVVAKFDLAMDRCLLELDDVMLKNTRDLGRIDGLFKLIVNHESSVSNVDQLRKQLVAKRDKLQQQRMELLEVNSLSNTKVAAKSPDSLNKLAK